MNGNAVAIGVVVTQAVGDPHFRRVFYVGRGREVQLKARGQHSDDLLAELPVRQHHMPEDGGIEAIPALEVSVTKNGHGGKLGRRGSWWSSWRGRGGLRHSVGFGEIA